MTRRTREQLDELLDSWPRLPQQPTSQLSAESLHQLGGGVSPPDELVGVVVGDADDPGDDHHRQPTRARSAKIEAAVQVLGQSG